MVNCSFCGDELRKGTGKLYAKKDGKILYFCTMKCEKNMIKLRRKPTKVRWTKQYIRG
jgi:large subunit ribosomal protein L24e